MTTQSIRNSFGMTLASTLVSDIQYLKANYYYYLGKVSPWGTVLNEGEAPDLSSSMSQADDNAIRANMIFAKKIGPSEVSLVINRNDWTAGKVYPRWDDAATMIDAQFYVMTSSVPPRVYKCIDNANGAPSMNEPSTSNYAVITTADGYVWKYMYSIPPFKVSKFASPTQMPVQRAISDSFYNNGSISDIIVNSGGSGYVAQGTDPLAGDTLINVVDTGHTAGSGATAEVGSVNAITGEILTVTILTPGSGYNASLGARATITNTGTRGGAILVPIISVGGLVTGMTITSGGLKYVAGDSISITIGGAILQPILDANGSIANVVIKDPGIGYVTPPTLTVTGVGGSAYSTGPATVVAILSEQVVTPPLSLPLGQVVKVIITDPGVNYKAGVTLTAIEGDGTGATCSPIISDGVITGIVLNNRGSGYTYGHVKFSRLDETGTGATFTVNISQQDYTSDQANVEQAAVAGAIYATQIVAGGSDYYQLTTEVTITGDGTGATAIATVTENNSITHSGTITGITILEPGSGYSVATITVTDTSTNSTNAVIRAIYTPPNGHGYDAAAELYARTVGISTVLSATDELSAIDQDYRQYGILRNPNNYNSSVFSSLDADLLCYQMFLSGTVAFTKDEVITYGSNNEYEYVVANAAPHTLNGENGTSVWLIPQFSKYVIPIGAIKQGLNSLTTTHTIKVPIINKYSGQLLLTSNENHFTFTNEQSFAIKSYIKL